MKITCTLIFCLIVTSVFSQKRIIVQNQTNEIMEFTAFVISNQDCQSTVRVIRGMVESKFIIDAGVGNSVVDLLVKRQSSSNFNLGTPIGAGNPNVCGICDSNGSRNSSWTVTNSFGSPPVTYFLEWNDCSSANNNFGCTVSCDARVTIKY